MIKIVHYKIEEKYRYIKKGRESSLKKHFTDVKIAPGDMHVKSTH